MNEPQSILKVRVKIERFENGKLRSCETEVESSPPGVGGYPLAEEIRKSILAECLKAPITYPPTEGRGNV